MERDRRRYFDEVGDKREPGDRRPAPGGLRAVQRFVNTYNHELGAERDRLATPERARDWLVDEGLLAPDEPLNDTDLARLLELRDSLRILAARNGDDRPDPVPDALREVGGAALLRVDISTAGEASLVPARGGIERVAARLLGILYEASVAGTWPRLKTCRQCEWVFFDRSKNRSSAWCAMSVCGNRMKNREYRRRKTTPAE